MKERRQQGFYVFLFMILHIFSGQQDQVPAYTQSKEAVAQAKVYHTATAHNILSNLYFVVGVCTDRNKELQQINMFLICSLKSIVNQKSLLYLLLFNTICTIIQNYQSGLSEILRWILYSRSFILHIEILFNVLDFTEHITSDMYIDEFIIRQTACKCND